MRDSKEIINKINTGFGEGDFGFGREVLFYLLSYDEIKEKFNEGALTISSLKKNWESQRPKTENDIRKMIIDYLKEGFKYVKMEKGLLSLKLINKMIALIWVLDDEAYEILNKKRNDEYEKYGINILYLIQNWIRGEKLK